MVVEKINIYIQTYYIVFNYDYDIM